MKRLVIVGAGGFGREALGIVLDIGGFQPIAFVDAEADRAGTMVGGVPVAGGDEALTALRAQGAQALVVAIGNPQIRRRLWGLGKELGFELPSLVHPMAYKAADVTVGEGSVFYPGSVTMAGVRIGQGVLVNAGATIGHETTVGDFVNVNPGANIAGHVTLGEGAFIGIGACVREATVVGAHAVVGAGSVVIRDVADRATVYGVPARVRARMAVSS